MRFTALAVTVVGWSSGSRPELGRASVSNRLASLGDVLSKLSNPSESLAALNAASAEVTGILAEMSGPEDHITEDDAELLRQVVTLVDKTIYSSMDDSHDADAAALAAAVGTAEACNTDITNRQSPEGDLGTLHQQVQDKQTELDNLQVIVDEKTEINNTKWEDLNSHMQMIAPAPACPDFPARTMPALDVYFEGSEYSVWFSAQQAVYTQVRDAFVAADAALQAAIHAYDLQLAIRNVQYCDWKSELDAACLAYVTCFVDASDYYRLELVPRVESDVNNRIEVYKAGETLIHQINFLLGDVESQETPAIDTSRYELDFPSLPGRVNCDQNVLTSSEWIPPVTCFEQEFELVGEGFCRTPLGGRGEKKFIQGVTLDACREQCFDDRSCVAIEYQTGSSQCELHTAFVDHVEPDSNGLCLAKIIPFSLVGKGWCRTPSRSRGSHSTIQAQTEGTCLDLCRADESCLGVEFDVDGRDRHECELHREFVDRVQEHDHGICLTKQTTFSLIGRGFCRTPSGGRGTHVQQTVESQGHCLALCRADDSCLAVEVSGSRCELHSEFVDRIQEDGNSICLIKD